MSQSVECIFDSALSHTRRSDAVQIRVDTLPQIRLSTSFESSLISFKTKYEIKKILWKIFQIDSWNKVKYFLFQKINNKKV